MASKQWLTGAAGALALAAVTGAAQSAPLGSVATDFRPDATNHVERAQYRLCAMEDGVRRCRSPPGPGVGGYRGTYQQYGYEFPDQYPVGSGAWWESMRQTDR
ncbi:unnamed protein product, partial [Phaeothamnion confervicola]